MRASHIFTFLMLAASMGAADGWADNPVPKTGSKVIEEALQNLLAKAGQKHPFVFVVVTDSKSGHFIQFGYEKEVFSIDIPLTDQSDGQRKQMKMLFAEIGVKRIEGYK